MNTNLKFTVFAVCLYAIACAALFGAWSAVVFCHVVGADTYVTWIVGALGTLFGHILTMLNPRAPRALPNDQEGPDAPT